MICKPKKLGLIPASPVLLCNGETNLRLDWAIKEGIQDTMQGSTQPEVWDSNIQLGNGCNKSIWVSFVSGLSNVCLRCTRYNKQTNKQINKQTNKQTNKQRRLFCICMWMCVCLIWGLICTQSRGGWRPRQPPHPLPYQPEPKLTEFSGNYVTVGVHHTLIHNQCNADACFAGTLLWIHTGKLCRRCKLDFASLT